MSGFDLSIGGILLLATAPLERPQEKSRRCEAPRGVPPRRPTHRRASRLCRAAPQLVVRGCSVRAFAESRENPFPLHTLNCTLSGIGRQVALCGSYARTMIPRLAGVDARSIPVGPLARATRRLWIGHGGGRHADVSSPVPHDQGLPAFGHLPAGQLVRVGRHVDGAITAPCAATLTRPSWTTGEACIDRRWKREWGARVAGAGRKGMGGEGRSKGRELTI